MKYLSGVASARSMPLESNPVLARYPHVHIDVFAYCNANCVFCGYKSMHRKKGVMPWLLYTRLIDEIGSWDTPVSVVPHHYGEFFLHPQWERYLLYLADHAPKTKLTIATNGEKLTDEKLDVLLGIPNLDSLLFSLYTLNPVTYERVLGIPACNIEHVLHLIERVCRERSSLEVVIGTSEELVGYDVELYDRFIDTNIKIVPHLIVYTSNNSWLRDSGCRRPCPDLFDTAIVLHNGDVAGCCFDVNGDLYLGNIYNESLVDIWNGVYAERYRRCHMNGERDMISLCRSCTRPCDVDRYVQGRLLDYKCERLDTVLLKK